ncbi:GtrA family protein [bacterium]|nr:GtrA family protein [bacterium]
MKRKAMKFLINGGISTIIHYLALIFIVEIISISFVIANILAGILGTTYSFIGNKYFVFKSHEESMHYQAVKFLILYGFLIAAHTLILFSLTNMIGFDYRVSFVLASIVLAIVSFLLNNSLVFNK